MLVDSQVAPGPDPEVPTMTMWSALLERFGGSPVVPARLRNRAYRYRGIDVHPTAVIGAGLHCPFKWSLRAGPGVILNDACYIDGYGRVVLEENVAVANGVRFLTTSHEIGGPERRHGPLVNSTITVERGAWIGAGAIILPGVTIYAGAIVGAGSVVNRDIPANSIWAGNPARCIRELD